MFKAGVLADESVTVRGELSAPRAAEMLHLTVPIFSRCEAAEPPFRAREGERAMTDRGSEKPYASIRCF